VVAPRHGIHQAYWAKFQDPATEEKLLAVVDRHVARRGDLTDTKWLLSDFRASLPSGWAMTRPRRSDHLHLASPATDLVGAPLPSKLATHLVSDTSHVLAG
jgi:hypothetical protein